MKNFESERNFFDYPIFKNKALEIFGQKMEVVAAPEPSNLIYENFSISTKERNKNKIKIFSIIVVFFAAIFTLFSFLKHNVANSMKKYPPNIDCEVFDKIPMPIFIFLALEDKPHALQERGNGLYMCYCKKFGKTFGDYTSESDICYSYFADTANTEWIENLITVSIVVINIIIRVINILFIKSIGYTYESQQIMVIMTTIFYSQFVNTGLLLMITNANFENTPLELLTFRNSFPDYTSDWYLVVGK